MNSFKSTSTGISPQNSCTKTRVKTEIDDVRVSGETVRGARQKYCQEYI